MVRGCRTPDNAGGGSVRVRTFLARKFTHFGWESELFQPSEQILQPFPPRRTSSLIIRGPVVVAEVVCNVKATRPDTHDTLWLARRYVTYMQTNYSALQNIQSKNVGIRRTEKTHGLVASRKICQNQSLLRKAQVCGGTECCSLLVVTLKQPCFIAVYAFKHPAGHLTKHRWRFARERRLFVNFWRSTRVGSLPTRRSINQALCSSPHHRCFHRNPGRESRTRENPI